MKLDMKKLKDGIRLLLPLMQMVARHSKNKSDDLVVAFLEQVLAADDEQSVAMLKAIAPA